MNVYKEMNTHSNQEIEYYQKPRNSFLSIFITIPQDWPLILQGFLFCFLLLCFTYFLTYENVILQHVFFSVCLLYLNCEVHIVVNLWFLCCHYCIVFHIYPFYQRVLSHFEFGTHQNSTSIDIFVHSFWYTYVGVELLNHKVYIFSALINSFPKWFCQFTFSWVKCEYSCCSSSTLDIFYIFPFSPFSGYLVVSYFSWICIFLMTDIENVLYFFFPFRYYF